MGEEGEGGKVRRGKNVAENLNVWIYVFTCCNAEGWGWDGRGMPIYESLFWWEMEWVWYQACNVTRARNLPLPRFREGR